MGIGVKGSSVGYRLKNTWPESPPPGSGTITGASASVFPLRTSSKAWSSPAKGKDPLNSFVGPVRSWKSAAANMMTTAKTQRIPDTQALFGLCSVLDMARRMSSSAIRHQPRGAR